MDLPLLGCFLVANNYLNTVAYFQLEVDIEKSQNIKEYHRH